MLSMNNSMHLRMTNMPLRAPVLLIVDYNLSRIGDVLHMRNYARQQWGAETWLVRDNPQDHDLQICDRVIDANPLAPDFVRHALRQLGEDAGRISAGMVFSDNAVASGAALLEQLGLPVDDAELALGAFDKLAYRIAERRDRLLLDPLGVMLPGFQQIECINDVRNFALRQERGFVIKPACEGNNRGVVMVAPGTIASRPLPKWCLTCRAVCWQKHSSPSPANTLMTAWAICGLSRKKSAPPDVIPWR